MKQMWKWSKYLRVGIGGRIGNGSLCETRIRTGVGVPQVSALIDVCSVATIIVFLSSLMVVFGMWVMC